MTHTRYKIIKDKVYLAIDCDLMHLALPVDYYDDREFVDAEDYQKIEDTLRVQIERKRAADDSRDKLLVFVKEIRDGYPPGDELKRVDKLIDEVEKT